MKKESTIPLKKQSKLPFKKPPPVEFPLRLEQVAKAVSALTQLEATYIKDAKKTPLFKDDAKVIHLQIVPIKVPTTEKLQLRVELPHSLSVDRDTCLIVKNLKSNVKPPKADNEKTTLHFKTLLKNIGIKQSVEVLPIAQLCDEYQTYEAKGKFAQLYDTFLVDGRMMSTALRTLGSRFNKSGKHLIPVNMDTKGLKKKLEAALRKSTMTVHALGDTFAMMVAHTGMTDQQISENVLAAVTGLCKQNMFPGGFGNLRSVQVKTDKSMAIPVFISIKKANSVVKPVNKVKLPKAYQVVEGELSTVFGGIVRVNPEGEVHVRQVISNEDRRMLKPDDSDDDITKGEMTSDDESDNEDVRQESKPLKRKASDEEDSDDDEEVVAAEKTYMSEWQEDFENKKSDDEEEDKEESDGEGFGSQTKKTPNSKIVKRQRKSTQN